MTKAGEECTEKLKKSWTAQCSGKAFSSQYISLGSLESAGDRAQGSSQSHAARRGPWAGLLGGQWQCPPSLSHPTARHRGPALCLQSCQHVARAQGSPLVLVCSAIPLIHHTYAGPPPRALHKLSRAEV